MLDFARFGELHPQVRDVCFGYYDRAQRDVARDEYAGLMDLWVAFANWMACVTEAELDADMVRDVAANDRMRAAFERIAQEDPAFRAELVEFSMQWPIYRSQDIVQHYGREYPYRFSTREEFTASIAGDPRVRRSPRGWEAGKEPSWPDLIASIYQVRCNLMHGHKSVQRLSDRKLVGSSYRLLLAYIQRSGCFEW